ncbi:hypothetical protein L9F63_009414, partial [Diploptera punctata]
KSRHNTRKLNKARDTNENENRDVVILTPTKHSGILKCIFSPPILCDLHFLSSSQTIFHLLNRCNIYIFCQTK